MTETTFQHVSVSSLSCSSFTDRSFLPMVPLAPLAADTVQDSMIANGTNGKIINGAIGGIQNVAPAYDLRMNMNERGSNGRVKLICLDKFL